MRVCPSMTKNFELSLDCEDDGLEWPLITVTGDFVWWDETCRLHHFVTTPVHSRYAEGRPTGGFMPQYPLK